MIALFFLLFTGFILKDLDQDGDIVLQWTHWYWALFIAALIIAIPTLIGALLLKIYVRTFTYTISEKFIVVKSGVITRNKTTIPFSRIQNINVTQGILDRLYNIYTVKIETAGTASSNPQSALPRAEGFIPGIIDPSQLESMINRLVHQYTQDVPSRLEGFVFDDKNLVFDEFIAYILNKLKEENEMKTTIKELRTKANITQVNLAEQIGVSRQTIIYLEKGKYVPSLTLALKLAAVFSVTVEELFQLDESDYKKKKGK